MFIKQIWSNVANLLGLSIAGLLVAGLSRDTTFNQIWSNITNLLGLSIAGLLVAGLLLPCETNAEDAKGIAISGLQKKNNKKKIKINLSQKRLLDQLTS
jgi:hypothetical protein